ncbi:MAG: hypothetical protein ABTB30_14150, partial [Clostridia bacterium]
VFALSFLLYWIARENTIWHNHTLRPGETKSTDQEILYGFNQAKTICAAVVKLHYTDGTIVECPEPEYLRFELAD